MPDAGLPRRTLLTGALLTLLAAAESAAFGRTDIALGLVIGAAVSGLSLWTLMVAVPRVMAPGVRSPRAVMAAIGLIKLPIYALLLNWAVTATYIDPVSVFVGAAVMPTVLVLKVVGHQLRLGARSSASPVGDEACPSQSTTSTASRQ